MCISCFDAACENTDGFDTVTIIVSSFDFCEVDANSPDQDPVENLGQVNRWQHGIGLLSDSHSLPLFLGCVWGED